MTQNWELPLILSDELQKKYNSTSQYEPPRFGQTTYYAHKRNTVSKFQKSISKIKLPAIKAAPRPLAGGVTLYAFQDLQGYIQSPISFVIQDQQRRSRQEAEILLKLAGNGQLSSLRERLGQFKDAKGPLLLFSMLSKLLFHYLCSEVCLRSQKISGAIENFQFSEYYARKINNYPFTIHCLWEQAQIWQSLSEFEKCLKCLKSALQISLVAKNKEAQLKILEKLGLLYYYRGNMIMGEYYHNLSERGVPTFEAEIFVREYRLQDEIVDLEKRLFSLNGQVTHKRKNNSKYERDIHRDLQCELNQKYENNLIMCSKMLKSSRNNKQGQAIRTHIKKNISLASIVKHFKNNSLDEERLKELARERQNCRQDQVLKEIPIHNVSQVIKSHLGRNRSRGKPSRDWYLEHTIDLIKKNYEISISRCTFH